jgi:hypothetical protein
VSVKLVDSRSMQCMRLDACLSVRCMYPTCES